MSELAIFTKSKTYIVTTMTKNDDNMIKKHGINKKEAAKGKKTSERVRETIW
jgi:hypothetical protein